MKYLFDSNTLITAKNDCYRFDVCPGFWTWLSQATKKGEVGSITRVRRELDGEGDNLSNWAKHNGTFFHSEDGKTTGSMGLIAQWVQSQSQFTDAAKQEFFQCADHAIIAHAPAHSLTIVTFEKHNPGAKAKVQMPTVCKHFGVECINLYHLLSTLKARFDLK